MNMESASERPARLRNRRLPGAVTQLDLALVFVLLKDPKRLARVFDC